MSYQDAVLLDNPTAFWPLDDAGAVAIDVTGNSFSCLYINAPLLKQSGLISGGASVGLDGSTQFVQAGYSVTSAINLLNIFSQECWFKTTTVAASQLIGFQNASGAPATTGKADRLIYINATGNLVADIWYSTINHVTIVSTAAVNDGLWHHAVLSCSYPEFNLYLDGVLVGNYTNSTNTLDASWVTYYLNIGAGSFLSISNISSSYFLGNLTYAAFYLSELTAAQVSNHYNIGVSQLGSIFSLNKTWISQDTVIKNSFYREYFRVEESIVVTGTGAITTGATAASGAQTFSDVASIGDTFPIWIVDTTTSPPTIEASLGTYTAANTVSRTLLSGGSSALVSFLGNTCSVFISRVPGGNVAQTIEIADAISNTEAVSLGQGHKLGFLEPATNFPIITNLNSSKLGWAAFTSTALNSPTALAGVVFTFSDKNGTIVPSNINTIYQEARVGDTIFIRSNTLASGWTTWV